MTSKSRTTTRARTHPGEVLREEFMAENGLSINGLARALHVPVMRISDIVNERRGVTTDTAIRLARYFGTTPQFWLSLQANYDLSTADVRAIEEGIEPLSVKAQGRQAAGQSKYSVVEDRWARNG